MSKKFSFAPGFGHVFRGHRCPSLVNEVILAVAVEISADAAMLTLDAGEGHDLRVGPVVREPHVHGTQQRVDGTPLVHPSAQEDKG